MATIKILSAENGEVLQNIDNNILKLTQNSVIQVNADIDEVVTITRQGNSAVIQLKNGESIIIENYFDYPVDANRIVFENEGKLYWAEFTDQNGEMLDTILYHPLTEGTVESTNMAAGILPWLGGALAIGAIAAAAGSGGSSGGDSDSGSRDNTPPKLTGIIVNENGQLELSFNENVNGSNPRPEDFTVIVDGEEIPVTNIIVEGDKITLVTEPAIQDGQDVTVDYQDSAPNNDQGIKDSEGNVLDGLDSDAVGGVKNPDTTAPTLLSAEVNENGNIELSFNEALDADNLPPAASLVVTVGTAPDQTVVNVIDIIADGNILTLITDPLISAGQSVNVVYTDPSAGNDLDAIQDTAGNDAAGFNTADLPNGVVNNVELPLSLANDEISALLVNKTINTATPLATIDEQDLISVLPGDSRIAVMNFTIDSGTEDVVIAVQQDNLVDLAGAFTFVVRNTTTGEEFQVAAADTSQGGLVAGALGLELLGGVADAQGLRLDISDLPAGNYEVSIYGDSSQLADILTTVDLANLGDNTVNDLVSDTVLGLLETALTGPDIDPRGLLEQLELGELLTLAGSSPVLAPLVNTLTAILDNPVLSSITGNLSDSSVAEILSGDAGGVLGLILEIPLVGNILAETLNVAVNGLI